MNILDFIRDYTVSDGLGGRKLKVTTTGGQTDESIYTQSDPLGGRFIKVELTGGTGSSITVVDDYLDLPLPATVAGQFYWCEHSTGTPFIGVFWGGTYYPVGLYYSNGVSWEYMDTPAQATQAQVDAGTVTDQWVSPATLKNSSQWADYLKISDAAIPIQMGFTAGTNPSDNTIYYIGQFPSLGLTTSATGRQSQLPFDYTVIAANIEIIVGGTLGSAENSTLVLRIDNTTDTTISSTVKFNAVSNQQFVTGLNIDILSTNKFQLKLTTATWATNPTTPYGTITLFLKRKF